MERIRISGIALLIVLNLNTFAQPDKAWLRAKERIENMRIGIISTRLNMTTAEAEKFWPIYNEYRRKLDKIHQERIQLIEEGLNNSDSITSLSDNDAEKLMSEILKLNEENAKIQIEYYKKFSRLIGPKRAIDLYLSEIHFKRKLMREMRELKSD
ncbi:hypothetical protein [Schleiferia thermophila]|jgi:hypothetical protein|uniref:Sensor of ECF-type sigma factor n=1 Tax=Schleiferia thermophila TaxID=884107 RepID=A0A369A1V9_9FLAO|nr:hypothetical protein [Schleiferia thermophila]KFD39246.1 hypothetical protein AT05_06540 [Schleiferia thermophila str. Yellowstone]PMB32560.1 hypothetical protein CEN47_10680 [Fischerella thermalis CCMEE 5319]RCX03290.1 hypothetical protein DES35_103174 [Schleiferia thermophila]GCD80419.1 hypothetical protein JCM30197_16660 [Schleiferia thermophila]